MSRSDTRADIAIRRATPEDRPAVLELMRVSLGEGTIPRSRAYWRWKHVDNPFGASPVLVAEADGQLVGLRVFMRWRWQSGSRHVSAVRAVDTATHPAWRGQGIFTRLTLRLAEEMEEEGVGFVFNTPNVKSRPGYLKMGWKNVGRVSLWVRPLRPWRCLRALLGRRLDGGVARAPAGFPAASTLLEQPQLEGFLARTMRPADRRYATPRSPAYLRWRYAAVPGFKYYALWDFDGEDGAALVFRRRARRRLEEFSCSEVLVTPTSRGRAAARALLRVLARRCEGDYLVGMAAWQTPAQWALALSGFLPAPRLGPHLTVRPLNAPGSLPDPARRSSWRAGIGDLELF